MTDTAKFFQTEHIDDIFANGEVIKDGYPLPLEIEISLVDACTRKCEFCPRNNDEIAPNTSLKITRYLVNKLARELKEIGYKGLIMFSGYGEPLLHNDIPEIVKEFSFTYVDINTNGDLLTREKIKILVDSGVNKILISVYERDGVEKFTEMSKGFENHVTLRHRYENFEKLFRNRGGAVKQGKGAGICYYPYYFMMVDCNGDVFPCCQEWYRKLKMGNLYQQSFWDIWTSTSYRTVRRIIAEGNRAIFPCRICDVNGTYRGGRNYELYSELPRFRQGC